MQIGSHQVLAAEEEGEMSVLNLEAEALDVAKMMEAEAVVAEEGVELVAKVVTKVYASFLTT
jgi:U6 snRNA-associated Sm-like protein LSm4